MAGRAGDSRAAVICYPVLLILLYGFLRLCQIIFPLSGQAGETEALVLSFLFESWNIQGQMACFELNRDSTIQQLSGMEIK